MSAVAIALAASVAFAAAQPDAPVAPPESAPAAAKLRVGVIGDAPFVVRAEDGSLTGMSVDVFRSIARDAGLEYEWVPLREDVSTALDRLSSGDLDVAVGPISITSERLRTRRFTHPYFHASLSVASRPARMTVAEFLRPFASRPFLFGLGSLLAVLVLVGTLIWLAERRRNPAHFPASPVDGIGNGVWFALVTFTTVGYGDRAPVSLVGRILAGAWMLIALVGASSLTAGIATTLTLHGIQKAEILRPEDLRGKRVAVRPGTIGAQFTSARGAVPVSVESLDAAFARLASGDVVAVLDDRPMLQHWLNQNPDEERVLGEAAWRPEGYAFALPLESDLVHRLNLGLQRLRESGDLERLELRWVDSK